MVHTLPDYTSRYKMATVFSQIDTGELAARLGSIDTFDRRGNVIWMDDFEAPVLHWTVEGKNTGYGCNLTTEHARTGTQSCKITAGAGSGGYAAIFRYIGVRITGKIGYEVSFTVNQDSKTIEIGFRYYDGTYYYLALAWYSPADKKFYYMKGDGSAGELLTGLELEDSLGTFHTAKIVIDSNSKEYVRFLLDNRTVDLEGESLYKVTDTTAPCIYIGVLHRSDHADVKSIYVDDVIFTINEP